MFCPSTIISPEVWQLWIRSFMRLMERRSVDLPHPEGPIIAVTAFSLTSKSMSLRTCLFLNHKLNFLVSTFPIFFLSQVNLLSTQYFHLRIRFLLEVTWKRAGYIGFHN